MSASATTVPAGPTPLDRGRLRTRLAAGQATLGTFVGGASLVAAELGRARPSTPDPRGGRS
jgi:hypothetical protein